MCLFIEDWSDAKENYSTEQYVDWKDKTLAYYSRLVVGEQSEKTDDNAIKVKIVPTLDI